MIVTRGPGRRLDAQGFWRWNRSRAWRGWPPFARNDARAKAHERVFGERAGAGLAAGCREGG